MLLVSACNLQGVAATSLVRVDHVTGLAEPVPFACSSGGVRSGLGLVRHGDFVLHVHMDAEWEPHIAILDAHSLDLLADQVLTGVSDPHSVCVVDGGFAVASTGTDEVLAYRWSLHDIELTGPLWQASRQRSDTEHVNSVTAWNGRLLCSAFGPRQEESWAGAADGYIVDVATAVRIFTNLRHPHSVTGLRSGELAVCESATGRVLAMSPREGDAPVSASQARVLMASDAYVRGLAEDTADRLYVGISQSRNRSKSRGVELSDAEIRSNRGFSGVLEHVLGTTATLVRFSDQVPEVYDMLVL